MAVVQRASSDQLRAKQARIRALEDSVRTLTKSSADLRQQQESALAVLGSRHESALEALAQEHRGALQAALGDIAAKGAQMRAIQESADKRLAEVQSQTALSTHAALVDLEAASAQQFARADTELRALRAELESKLAALGPEHVDVAATLAKLGNAYGAIGDAAMHTQLLERALPVLEAARGAQHPAVATELANLGTAYRRLGRLVRSKEVLEYVLPVMEAGLGVEHPHVARALASLGQTYGDLGDTPKQEATLRRAYGDGVHAWRAHASLLATRA
eukprot:g7785.t1